MDEKAVDFHVEHFEGPPYDAAEEVAVPERVLVLGRQHYEICQWVFPHYQGKLLHRICFLYGLGDGGDIASYTQKLFESLLGDNVYCVTEGFADALSGILGKKLINHPGPNIISHLIKFRIHLINIVLVFFDHF